MRPRLEWLETFLAIAETASLTRAGQRVARSQSAVSLQLRQLEEALESRLFDRGTRHVALTAAGERLLPMARRALDTVDEAGLMVRQQPLETLRIGVPEEYVERLVPGLLQGGDPRDVDPVVELACADSAELERRVERGDLDYAVTLGDEISIRGQAICSDPVEWLEATSSGVSARRPLPVALFDRGCSWRSKALDSLQQVGLDYRVVFTSSSVAGVRAAIRTGAAVGALARSTAGPGLKVLTELDSPRPIAATELVLIGKRSEVEARRLIDKVRSAMLRE